MAFSLSFDFNDLGAQSALSQLDRALDDMTPFMEGVGSMLVTGARKRIDTTNTAPDGTAWAQSLRVKLNGGKTLHDSGQLLAGINARAAADHVLVGSAEVYAAVHQFGAVIRAKTAEGLSFTLADGSHHVVSQGTMPARPYIGVSTEDEVTIFDLVNVYFGDIVRGLQ